MILRSSHANSMRNVREKCTLLLLQLLLMPHLGSCGYLERHMNASADACLDFYEHACGGWARAHAGAAYRSQLEQLDHVYHGRLATLLEQQPRRDEPRFVRLLRDNFAACRAHDGRYNAAQFVRWLRVWGNIDMESEDNDWRPLLRLLKSYGLPALMQYEAEWAEEEEEEERATTSRGAGDAEMLWLLQLQPPWPQLAADAVDFQLLDRAQFRRLYRALQPLGVPQSQLWQQVKQLESQLWLCAHEQPETEAEAESESESESEADIDAESLWLLPLPVARWRPYLRRLSALLAAQPAPLLVRYLQLRLLHRLHRLQLLPAKASAPAFGRQECAAQSRQLLTHAAVWLLAQQQSPAQRQLTNGTLHALFERLRQRFADRLRANRNQFGSGTQRYLLEKLRRMRLRLGVLPDATDEQRQLEQLEAHYAQLQLSASDYYGNILAVLRQTERWAATTATETDLYLLQPDGFGSYASPFFQPSRNLVLLPLSLLGANLYRPHQGPLFTHSALGFLIAHELSHGFAPSDVHYDGRGRVATAQQQRRLLANGRFASQTRCLRRRHGQMADEKFADINGLAVAYDSYFPDACNASDSCGYSSERIFFLNFAQFFCQDDQVLQDSSLHGGSRQRVNDAVASSQHFARAFGCGHSPHQRSCQLY